MRYILLSVLAVPVIVILMLFNADDLPILKVEDLVVEKFASCGVPHHLCSPTTMTFVEDDILILQKNNGVVHQVQDNFWGGKELAEKPVLEVAVNPIRESGLLGVTSVGSTVYIYFTEVDLDREQLGNRIYKYDCDGDAILVLAIPKGPTCHLGTKTCFSENYQMPYKTIADLENNDQDFSSFVKEQNEDENELEIPAFLRRQKN